MVRSGPPGKKVAQIDYYTSELIEVYDSIRDEAIDNFMSPNTVYICLRNRNGKYERRKIAF